jgi:hypothetical protein
MELAESMLDDTQTSPENAPTRFSGIDLFLRGIGSVLEFFPPVERLDVWGATQAVSRCRMASVGTRPFG